MTVVMGFWMCAREREKEGGGGGEVECVCVFFVCVCGTCIHPSFKSFLCLSSDLSPNLVCSFHVVSFRANRT